MKILIAEDDLRSRTVLTAVLKKQGHEVVVTVNGVEAWQTMQQPDASKLAILDWMMPEMDGLEVVRRIRTLQTDQPAYIILLTAKSEKADIITGLDAGANDYLTKPFDPGELLARVEVGRRMLEMQAILAGKIEALQESEEKYSTILENIEVGYFVVDTAGNFTFINDSVCRILGRPCVELMGMNNRKYTDKENSQILYQAFNKVFKAGKPLTGVDYEIIRKDGTKLYIQSSASLIRNTSGQPIGFRGIMRNITERKRMEAEMREMSLRDLLTDLYNRRGFITLAEQQIRAADRTRRAMLLMFIDCDGLKWINDTLGHKEGDKALIETANVLRQTFRKSDIIARLGGDEFAVLAIDAASYINPEDFPKRLQQNIDAGNAKEARLYKLAMSWGTTVYDPGSPLSLDELMSSADKRMYAQKMGKSNRRN
jgi:diguanylate cyclase (GGDEF)-like protein/PAS domain S-box-containing protein